MVIKDNRCIQEAVQFIEESLSWIDVCGFYRGLYKTEGARRRSLDFKAFLPQPPTNLFLSMSVKYYLTAEDLAHPEEEDYQREAIEEEDDMYEARERRVWTLTEFLYQRLTVY